MKQFDIYLQFFEDCRNAFQADNSSLNHLYQLGSQRETGSKKPASEIIK